MKLFFVVGSFKMGGTERTASRIGMELMKRGHQVKFILINPVFDYNEPELVTNSIVLMKDKSRNKVLRMAMALLRLIRLLKKEKPDYLISFSIGINLFIFFTFYRRIIFRIESNIFYLKKQAHRRYLQRYVSLLPNVKKIVIPSRGLFDQCARYLYTPSKLILVSNPVNIDTIKSLAQETLSDFPLLESGKFIVSAGRLRKSKGMAQLIDVFAKSTLRGRFKLVILGDGPEYKNLQEKIVRDKVDQDVFLLGYQSNPYRFFSRSRFFILNSDHESFGNVLIEALACDVPVVSNDCDFGPRHIIQHDYNGLLYDRKNAESFTGNLEKAAFDEELHKRLCEGARESQSRYKVETIADYWDEVVLEGGKAGKNVRKKVN